MASCFLSLPSAAPLSLFLSQTVIFLMQEHSSPTSLQKSCPFSVFLREAESPVSCCTHTPPPLCPSVPLASTPGCARADVKGKGKAQAMPPPPASAPGFLPKWRCPQALLSFCGWVGWTGNSLNLPYSENNVVTVEFQQNAKSLRSKRFLHLNVKSNGSIY